VPATISLTYAGDSITQIPKSWMRQLSDRSLRNVGGTAIGGATTAKILSNVSHRDADVLVVMAGTNDVRFGYSSKTVKSNITSIAKKVGARHVVLSAIAPSDIVNYGKSHINRKVKGEALNRDLQGLAAERGWVFVDPWASIRRVGGGWSAKKQTYDGVHPTVVSSTRAKDRLQPAIHIAVEGSKP
jgi:lysophospholipase L1-like esterase